VESTGHISASKESVFSSARIQGLRCSGRSSVWIRNIIFAASCWVDCRLCGRCCRGCRSCRGTTGRSRGTCGLACKVSSFQPIGALIRRRPWSIARQWSVSSFSVCTVEKTSSTARYRSRVSLLNRSGSRSSWGI
jgi:hypothetical protein